mgnify:CR=1 FL=1
MHGLRLSIGLLLAHRTGEIGTCPGAIVSPTMAPVTVDLLAQLAYCTFRRSITVPSSFSSTTICAPSAIDLVFTSIRSSGNTFSPSGV